MPSDQTKIPKGRWRNLKDNVSIVEVIEHLTGKRLGLNAMIQCPLHDDSTASMKVNEGYNGAQCFGACGKWFDPISFWATFQGVRPVTALLDLEKLFNVKWDGIDRQDDDDEDDLSPFEDLSAFFLLELHAAVLPHDERMKRRRQYWLARGEGRNVPALCELIGQEKANRIITKWRDRA